MTTGNASSKPLQHFHKFLQDHGVISASTWETLQTILREVPVRKSEVTVAEGSICRHIDFIAVGSFRSFVLKEDAEVTTGLFLEGELITSMKSIANFSPSPVALQALEDSVVVRFTKEGMIGLYGIAPEMQQLGRLILERLVIEENEWKEMFTLYNPEERYRFLLKKSPGLIQRVPLSYIASFLGMRRETLSRIRRRLKG